MIMGMGEGVKIIEEVTVARVEDIDGTINTDVGQLGMTMEEVEAAVEVTAQLHKMRTVPAGTAPVYRAVLTRLSTRHDKTR